MNRMEDANDAIAMIFEGGQFWLLGWCIVFIFSVAIMNYAGKSKVKHKMYLFLIDNIYLLRICGDKDSVRHHSCRSPSSLF